MTQVTREAFQGNVTNAAKVGHLIDEIAAASDEQAQGIGQIIPMNDGDLKDF